MLNEMICLNFQIASLYHAIDTSEFCDWKINFLFISNYNCSRERWESKRSYLTSNRRRRRKEMVGGRRMLYYWAINFHCCYCCVMFQNKLHASIIEYNNERKDKDHHHHHHHNHNNDNGSRSSCCCYSFAPYSWSFYVCNRFLKMQNALFTAVDT
jgi:Ca2+/H+ antiporter